MEKPPEQPWENRCAGCFLLPAFCICSQIPKIPNRHKVFIVRHVREHRKSTNTARLAARALEQCKLLTYGDRDYPLDFDSVPNRGYLLFPEALDHSGRPDPNGPPVHDLVQGPPPAFENLIVLDGTWAQARRMSHRLEPVAHMPRLSFTEVPPRARLRRPPMANTSATLEAIGHALWYLEGETIGSPLLQVFDRFVEAYYSQCNKPRKISPSRLS
ncbi:DTW domain-containing protein [bacterium]|nr:DTW domain-containing protein [bacterium]